LKFKWNHLKILLRKLSLQAASRDPAITGVRVFQRVNGRLQCLVNYSVLLGCVEDVIRYVVNNHDGTRKYWKVCYKVQNILFLFPCQVLQASRISVVHHGNCEVMYGYLYSRIARKFVRTEYTSLDLFRTDLLVRCNVRLYSFALISTTHSIIKMVSTLLIPRGKWEVHAGCW
jgi:hypothetical protein